MLEDISELPLGAQVAIELLQFHGEFQESHQLSPRLTELGRKILCRLNFSNKLCDFDLYIHQVICKCLGRVFKIGRGRAGRYFALWQGVE